MRKLTIKRRKSIVASLMKVKIYIEDNKDYGRIIFGYPCKEVGRVKNNSELVIEIDNNEHRIFADVTLQVTDVYADMIIIPAGEEDVIISGKNVYSPFKGNPFVFDKI